MGKISQQLEEQHHISASRSSLYRWLFKYTEIAINEAKPYYPVIGDIWIATKASISISRKTHMLVDILCMDTRYMLATHLFPSRSNQDIETLLYCAIERAGNRHPAKLLITDKLLSYKSEIVSILGSIVEVIPRVYDKDLYAAKQIDYFLELAKEQAQSVGGFRTPSNTALIMEGWQFNYNFFRPQRSLHDRTPAEKANIDFPSESWLDIINAKPSLDLNYFIADDAGSHSNTMDDFDCQTYIARTT